MTRYDTFSRLDLAHIAGLIPQGARVLDVGCGDGELLALLRDTKGVAARGLELSRDGVSASVARGLSVVQGDAERDLADYPGSSFDYVILTRTLQAMQRPDNVIRESLRVGSRAIVSFPNFGFWRVRLDLLATGRMPRSRALPLEWYNTPNIHLCTIRDFVQLCNEMGIRIEDAYAAAANTPPRAIPSSGIGLARANFFAEEAIFRLSAD